MNKKRKQIPLAEKRGVFQPFNYQATKRLAALLVCADVQKTSGALAREIKAQAWEKDVYGRTIRVEGLFCKAIETPEDSRAFARCSSIKLNA